jgi:hypothetical protein
MKKIISLLIVCIMASCHHPIKVTTIPDNSAATSGTLGSSKIENGIQRPVDTILRKKDTLKIIRDTL